MEKTRTPEGRGIVEEKWLLRKAFESEDLLLVKYYGEKKRLLVMVVVALKILGTILFKKK